MSRVGLANICTAGHANWLNILTLCFDAYRSATSIKAPGDSGCVDFFQELFCQDFSVGSNVFSSVCITLCRIDTGCE